MVNSLDLYIELLRPFESPSGASNEHRMVGGRVVRSKFEITNFCGSAKVECRDGFWIRLVNAGSGWEYCSSRQMELHGSVQPVRVTSLEQLRKLIRADLAVNVTIVLNALDSWPNPSSVQEVKKAMCALLEKAPVDWVTKRRAKLSDLPAQIIHLGFGPHQNKLCIEYRDEMLFFDAETAFALTQTVADFGYA